MAFPFINPVATILSGTSLSGAVSLSGRAVCGVILPATWTAAVLTFQGSVDGRNFFNLFDSGGVEISATVTVLQFIGLSASDFAGCSHIKVRSGTSGSPTNQGADRLLTMALRQIPNVP